MYMQIDKIRALIWKTFKVGFRYLTFVKIESCFLRGHLYKECQAGINDLDIAIEQKALL